MLGLGVKSTNRRTPKQDFAIMSLLFCKSCKLFMCSPIDVLKIETWWEGVSITLAERFHTPRCRILSEQSTVISCSRRLINVTLKANETPSRAGSIQQTPGCFVHGTVYNTVPAFVTSFTAALQSTRSFTQPFPSTRTAFLKLWSAYHKWSSGSALVVLLD